VAAARSLAIIYSDMVRSEGARWLSSPSVEYALLKTNEISIHCLQVTLQPRLFRAVLSVGILSRPRARQLCRKDDRHPPGHPAIAAVLNDRHLVLPRAIYLPTYLSVCRCTGSPRIDDTNVRFRNENGGN